jgi:glycosidase
MNRRYTEILRFLYGDGRGTESARKLESLVGSYREKIAKTGRVHVGSGSLPLDQTDAFLITYGDQFRAAGERPLRTLLRFLETIPDGAVSGVHILPFFPYTSDDGFSVVDYRAVDPALGTWADIDRFASRYRLMADLVLNHCSVKNLWFTGFLADDPAYRSYFISVPPGADVSTIVRPRALPLLTPFMTARGEELVWTTFSADQVDLNYASPELLLEMADVFLFYLSHGVRVIRLDAIAYLWKELGTAGIHHEKTHAIVRLFRAIIDDAAPGGVLITETNVPHHENISYFGDGTDEAHMVYQFPLPPLVLYAFLKGTARHLRNWAVSLPDLRGQGTFFNFLASHDGIGVQPARGLLPDGALEELVGCVLERGGLVSYKAVPGGKVPYELNISYRDAIAEPELPVDLKARKFLTSQAVMLALAGVPGIYIHSLIGSGNWREGVDRTGANRSINREKPDWDELERRLSDPDGLERRIFDGYLRLLRARNQEPAFHPAGAQSFPDGPDEIFAVLRFSPDGQRRVLCLQNTAGVPVRFPASPQPEAGGRSGFTDIITGKEIAVSGDAITLDPWQTLWLV